MRTGELSNRGQRRAAGRRSLHVGSALLALLLLTGCAADGRISLDQLRQLERDIADVEPVEIEPESLALTELQPYAVGSGDVLALTLVGLATDPYAPTVFRVRVHDDGTIRLPQLDPIKVAGLDLAAVERAVAAAHLAQSIVAAEKNLSVFAELTGPEATTVVVSGAAGAPGLVSLRNNERNVLYALGISGAFGAEASGRVTVRPIRPDRAESVYQMTDVNDLRRALHAPPLESGDLVIVEPAEASAVYLTGLVNAPGAIPVPPRGAISAMRAIAASGGLVDFLAPEEATLWRRLPDGRQVRVKIDLDGLLAGDVSDFALKAGDIFDVPHTPKTRFREWFAANVRIGPFGVSAQYEAVSQWNESRRNSAIRESGGGIGDIFRDTLRFSIPNLLVPPVTTVP